MTFKYLSVSDDWGIGMKFPSPSLLAFASVVFIAWRARKSVLGCLKH